MSLLDVTDAILNLVEPGGTMDPVTYVREGTSGRLIEHTGREPVEWEANHVYAFPDRDEHRPDGMEVRQEFEVLVVAVSDLTDEEPQQERKREVTEALNAIRDGYMTAVANQRTMRDTDGHRPIWDHAWCRAEFDYVRALGVRGIAVRVLGYRQLA